MHVEGDLRKLQSIPDNPVAYGLPLGERIVPLNPLIGKYLSLQFKGAIHCIHCGRKTSRSFNQGYCFPCMRSLAECDSCIVRPETCHFAAGTCRDEAWALQHCMQPHYVYLANTSGPKVGITRGSQVPTRWIDQGATLALPIYRVENRLLSGKLEESLRQHVSDRTDWRLMLQGEPEAVDLFALRDQLQRTLRDELTAVLDAAELDKIDELVDADQTVLRYPVEEYPAKVTALGFDKMPEVHGRLLGIKGQYLLLDKGVLNIRKHAGYRVKLSA